MRMILLAVLLMGCGKGDNDADDIGVGALIEARYSKSNGEIEVGNLHW